METKGWELYFDSVRKQDWASAKEVLKQIAHKEKYNPQVYLKMGDVCQRAGDKTNAIASYHLSARLLKAQGFIQKAIALYKIILRLEPANEEAMQRSREILEEIEASKVPHPAPTVEVPSKQDMQNPFDAAGPAEAPGIALSEMVFEKQPGVSPEETFPLQQGIDETWAEPPLEQEPPAVFGVSGEAWSSGPAGGVGDEQGGDSVIADIFSGMSDSELSKALDEVVVPPSKTGTARVPELFRGLGEEGYKKVLKELGVKSFPDKAKVIEEGDSGDSMYIVKSGRAKVVAHLLGKVVELAELAEGDVAGEVAFLTGRPRTADVIAQGPLEVYEITRLEIEQLVEKDPSILARLEDFFETRVKDTVKKIKKQ